MALATSLSFKNFVLAIGNTATPEVFTPLGAFTSRSMAGKLETGSTQVPDASDDSALMATELEGKTITWQVTADGITNQGTTSSALLRNWFLSGQPMDCQLQKNVPLAQDGGYYAGSFYLTDLKEDGKRAEKTTVSITLASTGFVTWVPASA
jgi:predicted secreted protein